MSLQPLSRSVKSLTTPAFKRKYIKLGRIYEYWDQIIGAEYQDIVLPVALKSRRNGRSKKDFVMVLHVITDSAHALPLSYQKDRILGRIMNIFGEPVVEDIKIMQHDLSTLKIAKTKPALTSQKKNDLSEMVNKVEDDELKSRLERFTRSLLLSHK